MIRRLSFPVFLAIAICSAHEGAVAGEAPSDTADATIRVEVDPFSTRSIGGVSELDRTQYFSISDPGTGFDRRVQSEERYAYLVDELRISFGRRLGLVNSYSRNEKIVREDPERPGSVDLARLQTQLRSSQDAPSATMLEDFGPRLDVALHGQHNAYPEFMGVYLSDWLKEHGEQGSHGVDRLPADVDAAAEFAAAVLKHNYDDFDRPRYFEPINEPHWSYMTEPEHLARWHLAVLKHVRETTPDVAVGGPCNSVGYLYSQYYRSFNGVRNFMDATSGKMDFYSFHVYDYYELADGRFTGSILSGLPLEGVLDLVPNYSSITFGHEVPIVVSEHGGYLSALNQADDLDNPLKRIARGRFPGAGFAWEMKARSIHDYLQMNSMIANTLVFMDHPHILKKAVPFVLLESAGWDPRYYATLYSPNEFDPRSKDWAPSALHLFYRLFRDLQGRRVVAHCPDPDILLRAFVDGRNVFVVAHNLAEKPEVLTISAPPPQSTILRRFGCGDDLTPFLVEERPEDLSRVAIGARETIVIRADYGRSIDSERTIEETAHYGDAVTIAVEDEAIVRVAVPEPANVQYATLRVGYNRPHASGRRLRAVLNGEELTVPVEDSAARYDHEKHGYSTTKLIAVDPSLLKPVNTIAISFSDGGGGTIGAVVLRTMRAAPPTTH